MCGRFSLYNLGDLMKWLHGLNELPPMRGRYNIAPTQDIAVARSVPGDARSGTDVPPRELVTMRWGYIPSWASDPKDLPLMCNARSETVDEKPAYRGALEHHRCLVPADGFFEWQDTKQGKQPYFIHLEDHELLGMAGIWSTWTAPDGTRTDTCTILTCPPNELVATLHDRMPVLIHKDDHDAWLDPHHDDPAALKALLRPYPAAEMAMHRVTPKMNDARYENADAVRPTGQKTLF